MFKTMVEALDDAALVDSRGLSFLDDDLARHSLSWSEIAGESKRRGRYLVSLGFGKGDRMGMIVSDEREFILSFLGAVSVGIVPVPVYPPLLTGRLDSYLVRTADILRSCGARLLLTPLSLLSVVEKVALEVPSIERCLTVEAVLESGEEGYEGSDRANRRVEPSDICFLQFTSGSTGEPKGAVITHQSAIANIVALIEGLELDAKTEKAVCWLPLYHDMGLVAFVLLPTLLHSEVTFMSPMAFVTRPQTWLETISEYGATTSASPNFGLALAAKYSEMSGDVDLSCLNAIICGAEPIHPDTVRRFCSTFGPLGLRPTSIVAAYGMAEATLCIALSGLREPFRTLLVDREKYVAGGVVEVVEPGSATQAMEIASCGRVIRGHKLGIADPEGRMLGEGRVGEILFGGTSASQRYFWDTESSAEVFRDGWVRTGDLGFVWDEELYVSGRIKDLVIIAGHNYHCQLIEWCVERVAGIRAGNVVAFSLSGGDTERLVVVAECREQVDVSELRERVERAVLADFGVRPYDVVVTRRRTLPKTSSGKLRRRSAKEAYESGSLSGILK